MASFNTRDEIPVGEGLALVDIQRERQPVSAKRGLDGIPVLGASAVIRPRPFNAVESASIWVKRTFPRKCYVWCPTAVRTIRFLPDYVDDGTNVILRGEFFSSITGIVRIPAAGDWYFNLPIVVAEGTQVGLVYADALGDVGVDPQNIIGASAPGALAVPDPAVWVEAAALACAASAQVFAASVTRRGVSLANVSTDGSVITVSISNPAVDNVGILSLQPGVGYIFGPTDKCTQQQLFAKGSAAGATLLRSRC